MNMGSLGTFVISWSQTEVDGVAGAPQALLTVGATWRWSGRVVRVDRSQDILLLDEANGASDLRKRAARMVRRLVGAAVGVDSSAQPQNPAFDPPEQGFIVTDGRKSYSLTLIPVPDTGANLLMIVGQMPPWIKIFGWFGPHWTQHIRALGPKWRVGSFALRQRQ